jgi:septum formation topological specificity factor MinE
MSTKTLSAEEVAQMKCDLLNVIQGYLGIEDITKNDILYKIYSKRCDKIVDNVVKQKVTWIINEKFNR